MSVASAQTPAPSQDGTLAPRPKKKKRKIVMSQPAAALDTEPVQSDPYAIVDPYSLVGGLSGDGLTATADQALGATSSEGIRPKKRKKKVVKRIVQSAPVVASAVGGLGTDPYA